MEASHPSPSPELRLGLQRRAFPGRGAGNPRMASSLLASDPAPTSAFSAGTFLRASGKASSRGWGSWEPQVVYLLGRLRFPGTFSASRIPLGPPLALVCLFFALPFLFAPISRLLSTTPLSPGWSPAPFSLSLAPPLPLTPPRLKPSLHLSFLPSPCISLPLPLL